MNLRAAGVAVALLGVIGCGQKGPLVLPEHTSAVVTRPGAGAQNTGAAPATQAPSNGTAAAPATQQPANTDAPAPITSAPSPSTATPSGATKKNPDKDDDDSDQK